MGAINNWKEKENEGVQQNESEAQRRQFQREMWGLEQFLEDMQKELPSEINKLDNLDAWKVVVQYWYYFSFDPLALEEAAAASRRGRDAPPPPSLPPPLPPRPSTET
jgi:hypothetical protein